MLKVSPMATHCVAMAGAYMVMSSHSCPRQPFQHKTKSARRYVEPAWLEPDPVRVGHPTTVIFQIQICDEMLTASSVSVEAIRDTVEGDDRHVFSLLSLSRQAQLNFLRSSIIPLSEKDRTRRQELYTVQVGRKPLCRRVTRR